MEMYNEEECEACKALRRGLTWLGYPPKCPRHQRRIKPIEMVHGR